jgi:GH15 family glucan-1,4-alpha-glucosidase
MAQDLRELMRETKVDGLEQREGHQSRFQDRLAKALPEQDKNEHKGAATNLSWNFFLKIAAVIILAGGIVWFVSKNSLTNTDTEIVSTDADLQEKEDAAVQLSDLSPQFKKVEDYYLASINVEIARLEITDENKELVDAFLKQLAELDAEYARLNKEITESGISEEMVNAMVENLRLRLELLSKLKKKLSELKASEDAEQTV